MRAVLRSLLSLALAVDPVQVDIRTAQHGKPYVPTGPYFSVSHSHGHGLIALREEGPVGIDLEMGSSKADWAGMARLAFHPEEAAWHATLEPAQQRTAFLDRWTVREALLKAAGTGIAVNPSCLRVDISGSTVKVVSFDPKIPLTVGEGRPVPPQEHWWAERLSGMEGFAAVAFRVVGGRLPKLNPRRFRA